jgi:hypothetical protein
MEYLIIQLLSQFARLSLVPYLTNFPSPFTPLLRFHSERVGVGWKREVVTVRTPAGGDGRGAWELAYK